MDSTNSSNDFSRSFSEYNSSGLEDSVNTNQFLDNIEHPITKTVNEILGNKMTLKGAQSVAKLINDIPGSPVILPTNVKSMKNAATMRFKCEFYVFCDQCNDLCDTKNWCIKCKAITKKTKSNFLVYIPVQQQIKNTLDQHFEAIVSYMKRNRNDSITDIDDGKLIENARKKNHNSMVLAFTLNTDGAQIHNSQKSDVWPVQMYQNFLPPHLRFKSENIIVTTLYYGKNKPDVAQLLYHLSKEFSQFADEKISFFRNGTIHHCLPIISNCSADLPARSMLSGLKLFNGSFACVLCLHPGISICDHLHSKYIRYVEMNPAPHGRTHESVISAAEKLSSNRSAKIKSIDGVIKIPPMILFSGFDLSKSFAIDYMHNGLLGIMKLLLDFWLGSHRLAKKSPYFKPMTTSQREQLNERILALEPYERITRKPSSIFDRAFYKATEYKQLLLFYLPVALEGLIETKQLDHFKLLSAAIYTLLKAEISTCELDQAHQQLLQFANEFENIYGKEAVTMNVHLLRHYKESVMNHGPLWAVSMFGFESNIGAITKCSKNIPTDDIQIMSLNYCLWRPEKVAKVTDIQLMRGKFVLFPDVIKSALINEDIKPSAENRFYAGDAVNYKNLHYKSKQSKKTRSVDYFMEMTDGSFGCVYSYVKCDGQIYAILEGYEVLEEIFHLKKVKTNGCFKVYPFTHILHKVLYLKFPHVQVVAIEPNYFEN